jgi:shikimate kinase
MKAAGPVVWLRASIPVLAARIAADATTAARRPNLAGGGIEEITQVLAAREPLYCDCASLLVDTDDLPVEAIVERICRDLPQAGHESSSAGGTFA